MNAIWGVLLTLLITMGMLAVIVFGLGDTSVFVPPPEAAAEGFMRELATGRYERARSYLTKELAARTSAEALKELTQTLKSWTGEILDAQGEPGWATAERAEAHVKLKTRSAGEPSLRLTLWREDGTWAINSLWSLGAGASDLSSNSSRRVSAACAAARSRRSLYLRAGNTL